MFALPQLWDWYSLQREEPVLRLQRIKLQLVAAPQSAHSPSGSDVNMAGEGFRKWVSSMLNGPRGRGQALLHYMQSRPQIKPVYIIGNSLNMINVLLFYDKYSLKHRKHHSYFVIHCRSFVFFTDLIIHNTKILIRYLRNSPYWRRHSASALLLLLDGSDGCSVPKRHKCASKRGSFGRFSNRMMTQFWMFLTSWHVTPQCRSWLKNARALCSGGPDFGYSITWYKLFKFSRVYFNAWKTSRYVRTVLLSRLLLIHKYPTILRYMNLYN